MSRKGRMVDTVAGVAFRRVGFLKARQGLTFAACWWIATNDLGRPPATVDEYSEWWREKSRSQSFRDQAAFRAAFPEFATPTELADAVGYDFANLRRGSEAAVLVDLAHLVMP